MLKEPKNKHGIRRIIIFLYLIIVIMVIYVMDWIFVPQNKYESSYEYTKPWQVTINDKKYSDVNLKTFSFSPLQKGDTMIMTSILPDLKYKNPTIKLLVYHTTVDVYLDNQLIYTFGHERYKAGKVVGYGYHFIELPKDYAKHKLKIEMHISEADAFSSFEPIMIDSAWNTYYNFLQSSKFNAFISFFMVILGFILCLVSVVLFFLKWNGVELFWISLLAITSGVWSLCNDKIVQLWSQDLVLNQAMEFASLYTTPFPFIMFTKSIKKDRLHERRILNLLAGNHIVFFIIVIFMHYVLNNHYSNLLRYFHVIALIDIIVLAFLYIYNFKRAALQEKWVSLGFIVCGVTISINLLLFNLSKYTKMHLGFHITSMTIFGVLILIVSLLISYALGLQKMSYQSARAEFLSELAFTDYLTKIYNRAKCQEILEKYKINNIPYAIVNFDLNNLKPVNDNFGHEEGDKMLVRFAEILSKNFSEFGSVGRMGGDEFIAIIPESEKKEVEPLIDKMYEEMQSVNKNKFNHVDLTAAYGIAYSREIGDSNVNSDAVCVLADKRMYKMKTIMKMKSAL